MHWKRSWTMIEDYVEENIYELKKSQNNIMRMKLDNMIKADIGEIKRVDLLEEEMNYHNALIEESRMEFELMVLSPDFRGIGYLSDIYKTLA